MPENQTLVKTTRNPAFWGPLSLVIPAVVAVIGFLSVASGSKGVGGDMVGFGILAYAIAALGAASVFGLVAACIAMKKEEGRIAFAVVGFVLNLPVALMGLYVLTRIVR